VKINIPANEQAWLFDVDPNCECCWSMGRYPPPCDIGDDLLFRFDGRLVARAICRGILKRGERYGRSHDVSRHLTGNKVVWWRSELEDFRSVEATKFGKPLKPAMRGALETLGHNQAQGKTLGFGLPVPQIRPLLDRGLVWWPGQRLTLEGWRVLLRKVDEQRRLDIENGACVCRICGCTENSACDGGCSWIEDDLCSECEPLLTAKSEGVTP
jgi:hypothetical protein